MENLEINLHDELFDLFVRCKKYDECMRLIDIVKEHENDLTISEFRRLMRTARIRAGELPRIRGN